MRIWRASLVSIRLRAALGWMVLAVVWFAPLARSAEASSTSDAIKAAYLHRFAAYVEWPATGSDPDMPFTIAVLGAEGVARELERLLPQLSIHNRRAQIRRVSIEDAISGIDILYVGPGSRRRARSLIETAAAQPVLIVSDEPDGLARGSAINFVEVGRNIRFEVSLRAAARSRLKIASALLSVAARVDEGPRAQATPGVTGYRPALSSACTHSRAAACVRRSSELST